MNPHPMLFHFRGTFFQIFYPQKHRQDFLRSFLMNHLILQ
ncbi:Uncharacterized protein dnm_061530 [Desulfonema magnum]|uniref:Uncharacterized protein n=1 Tax=Desulfonema magnum TaxID=45655 RepID=A0A975BRH6_9BACT|nr:Uncharacterized protein dnm_061530 [Desulfonema magnum]